MIGCPWEKLQTLYQHAKKRMPEGAPISHVAFAMWAKHGSFEEKYNTAVMLLRCSTCATALAMLRDGEIVVNGASSCGRRGGNLAEVVAMESE